MDQKCKFRVYRDVALHVDNKNHKFALKNKQILWLLLSTGKGEDGEEGGANG